jgi:hypothetical protein
MRISADMKKPRPKKPGLQGYGFWFVVVVVVVRRNPREFRKRRNADGEEFVTTTAPFGAVSTRMAPDAVPLVVAGVAVLTVPVVILEAGLAIVPAAIVPVVLSGAVATVGVAVGIVVVATVAPVVTLVAPIVPPVIIVVAVVPFAPTGPTVLRIGVAETLLVGVAAFVIGVAVVLLMPVVPPATAPVTGAGAAVAAGATTVPPAMAVPAGVAIAPTVPLPFTMNAGVDAVSVPTSAGAGLVNWPVGFCMLSEGTLLSPGDATPRTFPRNASSALIVANASTDADSPDAGEDEIIAWGSTVPEEEPGVDVAFGATGPAAGALIAGSPFPGVRFVVQPNTARELLSAMAARIRRPPCSVRFVDFEDLRMMWSPPCLTHGASLFRASGMPPIGAPRASVALTAAGFYEQVQPLLRAGAGGYR